MPPGPEREAILAELMEALVERAGNLPAMIDELRTLMVGRDLTQLINSVVVLAMTGLSTGTESVADGDATSAWAAKVEYLVGMALSLDPGGIADTPPAVTQRVSQLITDIVEADQARMLTVSRENAGVSDSDRELLL
ncbi:hypothetical protein [Mycolicibacterium peregrinum]|uniref:hypothetical protein n=2 Tax=Mycolicibacterium peregrinum TaxID=43304 RepID=UPI001F2B3331|nr:hypothetical protein [Mycolicibacterium peregrinum]